MTPKKQNDLTPTGDPALASASGSALSTEMQRCLDRIAAHDGTITRYPGGFWIVDKSGLTYGTTTVQALVKRGWLEYCEWKENSRGKFPIKARIAPNEI